MNILISSVNCNITLFENFQEMALNPVVFFRIKWCEITYHLNLSNVSFKHVSHKKGHVFLSIVSYYSFQNQYFNWCSHILTSTFLIDLRIFLFSPFIRHYWSAEIHLLYILILKFSNYVEEIHKSLFVLSLHNCWMPCIQQSTCSIAGRFISLSWFLHPWFCPHSQKTWKFH